MRSLVFLIVLLFGVASAQAQFWPDTKPKPKPKPQTSVSKLKSAPAPEKKTGPVVEAVPKLPEEPKHIDPETMKDPFVVLFTNHGQVVACRQVKGSIRFIEPPRKPMVLEQECAEMGRSGLVEVCKRYVLKETSERPEIVDSKIGFWDAMTGTYQVWSGGSLIYNKKIKVDFKAPGC